MLCLLHDLMWLAIVYWNIYYRDLTKIDAVHVFGGGIYEPRAKITRSFFLFWFDQKYFGEKKNGQTEKVYPSDVGETFHLPSFFFFFSCQFVKDENSTKLFWALMKTLNFTAQKREMEESKRKISVVTWSFLSFACCR